MWGSDAHCDDHHRFFLLDAFHKETNGGHTPACSQSTRASFVSKCDAKTSNCITNTDAGAALHSESTHVGRWLIGLEDTQWSIAQRWDEGVGWEKWSDHRGSLRCLIGGPMVKYQRRSRNQDTSDRCSRQRLFWHYRTRKFNLKWVAGI